MLSLLLAPGLFAAECKGKVGGQEGQCAPDFSLPDINGKTVKLSGHQGKVIFLNFWATWCKPCVDEMASMRHAYSKLKSKDFEMVAVSIDSEGFPAIKKFFGDQLPEFQLLLDQSHKVSHEYGTFKVPETYIIDKTGKVRDRVEGIREWDDSLFLHYLELLKND